MAVTYRVGESLEHSKTGQRVIVRKVEANWLRVQEPGRPRRSPFRLLVSDVRESWLRVPEAGR